MSDSPSLSFGARDDRKAVENALVFAPKFDEHGLIVAIAQDADTGEVLMVAYMNEESLRLTIEKGEAVYFSRSRQQLWHKGATSGHVQTVERILTDCDQDALVLKVRQHGPGCCHSGYRSCFYRRVEEPVADAPVPLGPEIPEKAYDPAAVYGH
jgi:phosphoribosyl-AMP cyclohydrolase